MKTVTIHQKALHTKQKEVISSLRKRKVVATGRRAGKTTAAAWLAAEKALAGRRVLFAAPTSEQIQFFWKEVKRIFQDAIDSKTAYKNETLHVIKLLNLGTIKAKTAWNADTLRGDYADVLILEEYAMMNPDAWDEVGAPMLLDNNGDAWFISSPKRRNHFHKMFLRGNDPNEKRWKSFHFTSFDNPFLSETALEEIIEDMTENAYKQEIMAEFLEDEGMVFSNLEAVMVAPRDTSPRNHSGHKLVMGLDWGKRGDYTSLSLGCATCKEEVLLWRVRRKDYPVQRQYIHGFYDRWKVSGILAESNSMGEPNIDEMKAEGLPVEGFATTAVSKPGLIEGLALAVETQEWKFLDDPTGKAQMLAYEVVYSDIGRPKYFSAPGIHDDDIISRALMVRKANEGVPLIVFA